MCRTHLPRLTCVTTNTSSKTADPVPPPPTTLRTYNSETTLHERRNFRERLCEKKISREVEDFTRRRFRERKFCEKNPIFLNITFKSWNERKLTQESIGLMIQTKNWIVKPIDLRHQIGVFESKVVLAPHYFWSARASERVRARRKPLSLLSTHTART